MKWKKKRGGHMIWIMKTENSKKRDQHMSTHTIRTV